MGSFDAVGCDGSLCPVESVVSWNRVGEGGRMSGK